jgi:hypothetical protein
MDGSTTWTDHNVYILGAGFSAEAGPPVVKHFMERMTDATAWLRESGGRQDELQAIQNVLGFRVRAKAAAEHVPLNLSNVEELFSLASTVTGQPGLELSVSVNSAIAATLDFARKTAPPPKDHENFHIGILKSQYRTPAPSWSPSPAHVTASMGALSPERDWFACPPFEFYVGAMTGYFAPPSAERRNTFITLNYDTVIEDALSALNIPYSYALWPHTVTYHWSASCVQERQRADAVNVLKLHGSVNWGMFDRYSNMTVYGNYERLLRDTMRQKVVLVPPTWHKGWDLEHPVSAVWEAAVEAIRTATRLVIVGYSVPLTDLHFKYLLAAGFQENGSLREIFFVNPDLKDKARKKEIEDRLFSPIGLLRRERLDQGMINLVPATTREFFDTPRDIYSKPHRIRIGRALCGSAVSTETAAFAVSNMMNGFSCE